jgi:hypothetical protein
MTEREELAELPREERVRQIAHRLWEQEGCPEGRAEIHWFMACAIIDGETDEPDWLQRRGAPEAVSEATAVAAKTATAGKRRAA